MTKPRIPGRLGAHLQRAWRAINIPGLHREIAAMKAEKAAHSCAAYFNGRPTAIMIQTDPRFSREAKEILCRVEYGEAQWATERGVVKVKGWILSASEYQDNTELAKLMGLDTAMPETNHDAD